MSASYLDVQSQQQKRKGLAIASLILGIISIPTLGLLVIGALTGIALGIVALNQIRKDPAHYGGKGMAIGGIVTSAVSLLIIVALGILAAIAVPKLNESVKRGRETAALNSLRTIHNNQMRFKEMNSRFASLEELAGTSLLDRMYAGGNAVSGYIYSSSGVSEKNYCVHAVRASGAIGNHDFIVCEDGIIHFVQSKRPSLVKRGEGPAIDSSFYSSW
jgi:Tfp pilus assembly protein PilE